MMAQLYKQLGHWEEFVQFGERENGNCNINKKPNIELKHN